MGKAAAIATRGRLDEPRGHELVRRYKANYRIPEESRVTEEMVLHHWTLERRLTKELLSSAPEQRWEVFERCYTSLYSELGWLNDLIGTESGEPAVEAARDWSGLIGRTPNRVYEVGSGKGRLIAALADLGYDCTATEITRERGAKWTSEQTSLRWCVSDGVHLDRFETPESFDAVISDQVIEHLHPDDLVAHFRGVYSILKPGGRYVFATPHAFEGPFDVSRVFGTDRAEGMHLKEYTYRELDAALRQAGFARVAAAFRLPHGVRARFGGRPLPIPSRAYRHYLCAIERVIERLPRRRQRQASRALRAVLWTSGITLIAMKRRHASL
ncbi:MAG TPA: methyltransferase domain-containing protein [Vicinamibacterales bacterium]